MKIKTGLLLLALGTIFYPLSAQQTRLKYLGIETGLTFIESEISDIDYIRGEMPTYYMGYTTDAITSWSYKDFVGIKYEILSLNDRFGLLGGIRFSFMNSSIGKNRYFYHNTNYFYWLYRQDGINTEFLKVKEINQKSSYIGIPVEIKYFTGRRPHLFQLYFKLGFEVNCLLGSGTDIIFLNPAMETYEDDIHSQLKKPGRINAAVYGGGGFRIGRDMKPSLSIEACMPYLVINSGTSGMLKPLYGGGFQVNFQIPIKSSAK
ncbi:MAG TPA: hypothetical protein VK179_14110 [Bacteroidales bacterium]|nr:hypothetical protein [Bacteroidales bacterium]